MLLHSNAGIVFVGFLVSLWLMPRATNADYAYRFFGYACAIIMLLVATSEIMIVYPVPFYFMLGSGITLLYTVCVMFTRISKEPRD